MSSAGCWPRRGPATSATGSALAAGPLLVASQTHDPFLVAMAPLLQQLPWLLFGLYAGVVADRLDRRLVVIAVGSVARAGRARRAGASSSATGHVTIWIVLVAVFCLGTCRGVRRHHARHAHADAGREARTSGSPTPGSSPASSPLNQLVGPPIGAGLFARGHGLAVRRPARVRRWLAAAIIAGCGCRPRRRAASTRHPRADRTSMEGLRWLLAQPAGADARAGDRHLQRHLGRVLVGAGALRAPSASGSSEAGFGLLTTAAAIGGLLSTSAYGWLERQVPLGTLMQTCLAARGAAPPRAGAHDDAVGGDR